MSDREPFETAADYAGPLHRGVRMRKIRWTLARWAIRAHLPMRFVERLMPPFTKAEWDAINERAHARWLAIQQCLAPEDRDPDYEPPPTEQETTR